MLAYGYAIIPGVFEEHSFEKKTVMRDFLPVSLRLVVLVALFVGLVWFHLGDRLVDSLVDWMIALPPKHSPLTFKPHLIQRVVLSGVAFDLFKCSTVQYLAIMTFVSTSYNKHFILPMSTPFLSLSGSYLQDKWQARTQAMFGESTVWKAPTGVKTKYFPPLNSWIPHYDPKASSPTPTKRNMLIPLVQNLWGICSFSAKQIFQGCNYLFPKHLMRVLPKTKISKLRNHVLPKSYILKFENHAKTHSFAEIIGLQKVLGCDVTTPNPPASHVTHATWGKKQRFPGWLKWKSHRAEK